MNGHNQQFTQDPLAFIAKQPINGILGFKSGVAFNTTSQTQGTFDLIKQNGQVILTPYNQANYSFYQRIEEPITAYWCPFIQGNDTVGYVDIPKQNPPFNFVFTAAMNGCSLVTTESPDNPNMFRVYHNQHPDEKKSGPNRIILESGREVISEIKYENYGSESSNLDKEGYAPVNAFNFLYYTKGQWFYVIQPQSMNMVSQNVKPNRSLSNQFIPVSDITNTTKTTVTEQSQNFTQSLPVVDEQSYAPSVDTFIKNTLKPTPATYTSSCPLQAPEIAIYPVRYAINENPFLESLQSKTDLTLDDWNVLTQKKANYSLTKQNSPFTSDLPELSTREYTLRQLRAGWLYVWTKEDDWAEYEIIPPTTMGQTTTFKKTEINAAQDQRPAMGEVQYALYFKPTQQVYMAYSPVQWTQRVFAEIKEKQAYSTMRVIDLPQFINTMQQPHAEFIDSIDQRVADIFKEQADTTFCSSLITNISTEATDDGFKREQTISIPKMELIAKLKDPMNALFVALDDHLGILDDLLLNTTYPVTAFESYEHHNQRQTNIAQILVPTCGAGIEEFVPESIIKQGAGKKYQYIKDACNDLLEPTSLLDIYQGGTHSTSQENLENAQRTLAEARKKDFLAKWPELPKPQVTITNADGDPITTTWQQHIDEWNNTRSLRRKLDFDPVFDHLTEREQHLATYQRHIATTTHDLIAWLNKLPISLLGTSLLHDLETESQSLAMYQYADKILTFIQYDQAGQDWLKNQLEKPTTLFGYSFFHFNQEIHQFFTKIGNILVKQGNINAQHDKERTTALDYANLGASRLADYLGALDNPQLKQSKYYATLAKPVQRMYEAYCELIKTPLGDLYQAMQLKSLASLGALQPETITAYATFTTLTSSDQHRVLSNFKFSEDFITWKDQLKALVTEDKQLAQQNIKLSQKAGERKQQGIAYPKAEYQQDREIIKANSKRRKQLKQQIYGKNHRQPIAIIADQTNQPITMAREDYLFLHSGQQEAMQQGLLKIESRLKYVERTKQHINQWQGNKLPMAMVLWNLVNTVQAIKDHKDTSTIASNLFYTANAVGAIWLAPIWEAFSKLELRYTAAMLKQEATLATNPTVLLANIATKDLYKFRKNLVKLGTKVGSSAAIIEMVLKRVIFVNGLMSVAAAFEMWSIKDEVFKPSNLVEGIGQAVKFASLLAMVGVGIIGIGTWLGSSVWGVAFAMGAFVTTGLLVAGVVYLLATIWIELFHREGIALWVDNCVFGGDPKWTTANDEQNQIDELKALYKILLYPEVKIKQTRKLLTNFENCVYQTTGYWLQFSFPADLDYCQVAIKALVMQNFITGNQPYQQDFTHRIGHNGFWSDPSIPMEQLLPSNPIIGTETTQPDYAYTGLDNRFNYNVWLPADGLYNNSYLDLEISYPFDMAQKATLDKLPVKGVAEPNEPPLTYSFVYQTKLFDQKDILSHEQPVTPITALEFLKDSKENSTYIKGGKFNQAIKHYSLVVGEPVTESVRNSNDY